MGKGPKHGISESSQYARVRGKIPQLFYGVSKKLYYSIFTKVICNMYNDMYTHKHRSMCV